MQQVGYPSHRPRLRVEQPISRICVRLPPLSQVLQHLDTDVGACIYGKGTLLGHLPHRDQDTSPPVDCDHGDSPWEGFVAILI
jgi:hypothetical protein